MKEQQFIGEWSKVINDIISELQKKKGAILIKCKSLTGEEEKIELIKAEIIDAEIKAYMNAVAQALKISKVLNTPGLKYSLTDLVKEAGLGEYICTSFEEAENNDRRKNIVIIGDSDIYLTYKTEDGSFGEFVCWVSDEFEEDESVFHSAIEWAKDVYYRTEEDIDKALEAGYFPFDFKPYEEMEMEF